MKTLTLVVLISMLLVTPALARKGVDEITAHDVANAPKVILTKSGECAYEGVRLVLKGLAVPFYWMEKVAKK